MIKVGGATEVEVKEKKDRVDDALNATRAAVEEGIVPGGGVALLRAKKAVDALKSDNPDIQAGINIVRSALEAPIRQIAENSGVEGSIVVGKVLEKSGNFGFDAQSRSLWRHGRRPASSTRPRSSAPRLQDAASVAALLITTEAMIAEKPKDKAPPACPGRRRHGRHGFLIQPISVETKNPGGNAGVFSFQRICVRPLADRPGHPAIGWSSIAVAAGTPRGRIVFVMVPPP